MSLPFLFAGGLLLEDAMLTAIRQSDQQRVIGDLISKNPDELYFCDYCNEPVIHHKSDARLKIGHFKHKAAEYCPNTTTGESEIHLKMKMQMYRWLQTDSAIKNIELEKWLFDKQVRADVYFECNINNLIQIYVFECQASYITLDEIKRRTKLYKHAGILCYWFFPFDKLIRWMYNRQINEKGIVNVMRFSNAQIFTTNNQKDPIYYWNYDYPKFPIKAVDLYPYYYREKFTDREVEAKTKFKIEIGSINTPDEMIY